MLLRRDQVPCPNNPACKQCANKPCHQLFAGPIYPGKIIFVHRSKFVRLPCYTPSFEEEKENKKEPAPLTDDLEVITGQLEISNPIWEHTTDELKTDSADKAVIGDLIELGADIKNYPEKAKVTFDIYDVSSNTPLRITSVESKNENGVAKARWTVEDPEKKGENLKLAFEAIARSKASSRVEVPIIPKIDCDFVEAPDILFHHNSAVPCLDESGTLISSLCSVFKFAKENSDKEIVLFGHSDTSGDPEYNYDLSQWRAEGIKALLDNKKDAWLDIVELASKVEDYQQILKSLFNHGWPTDPGKVDNANGPKTEDAVNAFQGEYNNRFNGSLKQDGVMGQNTWSALFEVIRDLLVESVKSETESEPAQLVYSSRHDGIYPCGESFPIDEKGKDDYRSRENRRVEIVFFDKGKAPELIKPENKKKVKTSEAVIYDKRITEKEPVFSKQVKAENSETIILEWVYPQVFDASKPHKQYVNLSSNGKEQGNELTIKVKAKDPNAKTDGKKVYWRVTADKGNSKRNNPKPGVMKKSGGKLVEFKERIATIDTEFTGNESSIVFACGLAGGDKFTIEAGTDGKNFTSSFVVENWRRLWYQLTHQSGINIPNLNLSKTAFSMVNIELLNDNVMQFKINDVPERTYYKEWMFNPKGNDKEISVIGSHNKEFFKKYFTTKKSSLPKAHLIICQYQWDEGEISLPITCKFYDNDPVSIESPLPIIKPTLKGSVVISGKWFNHDNTKSGEITDACISIDRSEERRV